MLNVPEVYSPIIEVLPEDCDFGEVRVGTLAARSILIANYDGCHLHISAIRFSLDSDPAFRLVHPPDLPMVVPSETSTRLELAFAPTEEGPAEASLEILSDDPMRPQVGVTLCGRGVAPGGPGT